MTTPVEADQGNHHPGSLQDISTMYRFIERDKPFLRSSSPARGIGESPWDFDSSGVGRRVGQGTKIFRLLARPWKVRHRSDSGRTWHFCDIALMSAYRERPT